MPRRCIVKGCNSKSGNPEHRGVTYHSFPIESKARETWLTNCCIPKKKIITKTVLVCSRHFKRADFQTGKGNKFMLKLNKHPTIFPWGKVEGAASESSEDNTKETTTVKTTKSKNKTITQKKSKKNDKMNTTQSNEITEAATVAAESAAVAAAAAAAIIDGDGIVSLDTAIKLEHEIKSTNSSKRASPNQFQDDLTDTPLSKVPKLIDSNIESVIGVENIQLDDTLNKKSEIVSFMPGNKVEAQDFDGNWHSAIIVEVDHDDCEVLIKFEKIAKNNNKGTNSTEEWIQMNSSRLRSIIEKNTQNLTPQGEEEKLPTPQVAVAPGTPPTTKSVNTFAIGEKVMARWTGARKFPAAIIKILENDLYEVLFEDGFQKIVKANYIAKIKTKPLSAASPILPNPAITALLSTPKPSIILAATTSTTPVTTTTPKTPKTPKNSVKKTWPLIRRESLNLDELNLPHIPEDGEWCCHWVNDQPIGKEGFLTVGDHKKPTVIVEDWRLPPNWVKHMYQRSNVLGKWDVILVSPQLKRFRSKADLKQYIEEQGKVYNPDVYDFSIHRRRAKDINAYVFTKDYIPPIPQPKESAFAGISPVSIPDNIEAVLNNTSAASLDKTSPSKIMKTPSRKLSIAKEKESPTSSPSSILLPLEDGYVYVGALKVKIVDNLFRCPDEICNKNFRKENHLQIHVKHYHRDLAKLLGVFPNMQELACKRTVGTIHEEPLPKNHLPNSQFFAKVHQQEMLAKTRRKSISIPIPVTSPTVPTPVDDSTTAAVDKIIASIAENSPTESIVVFSPENLIQEEFDFTEFPLPTGDDFPIYEETIVASVAPTTPESPAVSSATKLKTTTTSSSSTPSSNKVSSSGSSSSRKSNRQRTTKRYLTANLKNPSQVFDVSYPVTANGTDDLEETRHSFNVTPDKSPPAKRAKNVHNILFNESIDGSSQTTGSLPDLSQSPKYINENGEIIKIVRMRQEEIINCLCSFGEEDGLMIQCELCLCWQHATCYGFEKQSQVPEKYVCYICRNPQRGRPSLKYVHDQDWLFEGKLPIASYHAVNPNIKERFEMLKKSHTLTGNLLEMKKFLHSLRVKINIAENQSHPKMYLWAKKWEKNTTKKHGMKFDDDLKDEMKLGSGNMKGNNNNNENSALPTVPQPEAPINPVDCQRILLEHIKTQQLCVMDRFDNIEEQILEMESLDCNEEQMNSAQTREVLSLLIRDLEVMKNISEINSMIHDEEPFD